MINNQNFLEICLGKLLETQRCADVSVSVISSILSFFRASFFFLTFFLFSVSFSVLFIVCSGFYYVVWCDII